MSPYLLSHCRNLRYRSPYVAFSLEFEELNSDPRPSWQVLFPAEASQHFEQSHDVIPSPLIPLVPINLIRLR